MTYKNLSDKSKKTKTKYYKEKYQKLTLKFNKVKDEVIIKQLQKQNNITEYIRYLVLRDVERKMKNEQENQERKTYSEI